MGLAEVLALVKSLADLGMSAPVQTALTATLAKWMGVPQNVLDAAIKASVDAPDPKA